MHHEIRVKLNELPEDPYPEELWKEKVDAVWQFIFHRMTTSAAGDVLYPGGTRSRSSP